MSWLGVETTPRPVPVVDQPRPTAAEALGACIDQLLFKRVDALEGCLDRVGELVGGLAAAIGAHELPEEAVVRVPAAIVADGGPLLLGNQVEDGEYLLDRAVGPLRSLERGVEVRNVRAVVFVVVDAHCLLVDRRCERVVGVRQFGQDVGHLVAPFFAGNVV